jgi:hypothetical protein
MALLQQFGPKDEEALKRMRSNAPPISRPEPVFVNPQQAAIPSQVAQPQSGFRGLLGKVASGLQDEEKLAQLGLVLSSMNPNSSGLTDVLSYNLESIRSKKEKNRTVELLNKMGRPDLASIVERQPELAKDVLKQAYGIGGASTKSYAPQLDPSTGQYYITEYDPNTNEARRVDISGAIGETPEARSRRELENELVLADYGKAQEVGQNAMTQANTIDTMIGRLNMAYNALVDGGKSGPFQQYLPAFDNATATLRQAANMLGIDIINSATFGALSEAELKLALETGLPMTLGEEELKKHILRRIELQSKLRNELVKQAMKLSAGQVKYSDYIKQYETKGGTEILLDGGGLPDTTSTQGSVVTHRFNEKTRQIEEVGP